MSRMMNYCVALILTTVMWTIGANAAGDTAAPNTGAAEHLTAKLAPMHSMSGTFEQEVRDSDDMLLQKAGGEFTVKRPRKLLWQTTHPYQHRVITDGKVLWVYDIDLEQASRKPFDNDLDQAPALLLSGEVTQLQAHYLITEKSNTDKSDLQFELSPIGNDAVFRSLTLTFDHDVPAALVMTDHFGQHTRIIFSQVKLNPVVDDAVFQFTPPDDIDVVIDE